MATLLLAGLIPGLFLLLLLIVTGVLIYKLFCQRDEFDITGRHDRRSPNDDDELEMTPIGHSEPESDNRRTRRGSSHGRSSLPPVPEVEISPDPRTSIQTAPRPSIKSFKQGSFFYSSSVRSQIPPQGTSVESAGVWF